MIKCPKCKSDIEPDGFYCDQCGDELKDCPDCARLGRGKCCTSCGKALVPRIMVDKTLEGKLPGSSVEEKNDIESDIENSKATYLVSHSLDTRLKMTDGGIIGRKTGDYVTVFSVHPYVSGTHACLRLDKARGQWNIVDLDSTNGTFVNGRKLVARVPCPVKPGDKVKIATVEFIME